MLYTPEILTEICLRSTGEALGPDSNVSANCHATGSSPASSFTENSISEVVATYGLTDLAEAETSFFSPLTLAILLGDDSGGILEYLSKMPVKTPGRVQSTSLDTKASAETLSSASDSPMESNKRKKKSSKRDWRSISENECPKPRKAPKMDAVKSMGAYSASDCISEDSSSDELSVSSSSDCESKNRSNEEDPYDSDRNIERVKPWMSKSA